MDTNKVALIIVSPDGGFNGEAPDQQIQCRIREDGVIEYNLADWDQEGQVPTGRVEHYEITVNAVGVTEAPEPAEQSAQEE